MLLTRQQFREQVFQRDNYQCVICFKSAQDAHHIIERKLWGHSGGYFLSNGASLCNRCHIKAENSIISCDQIREAAGIDDIILPKGFNYSRCYDKWGKIMADFKKYPRTVHIEGSSLQQGDIKERIPLSELEGKYLIIEEKMDGANTGISFTEDLEFRLQSRGHYLEGGDYAQFDQFKTWANTFKDCFFDILDVRYVMYGEWMSNFHSLYYDLLPHFFLEFDIYDVENDCFLSTDVRRQMVRHDLVKVSQVHVIAEGICQKGRINGVVIEDYVAKSRFISNQAFTRLQQEVATKFKPEDISDKLLQLNQDQLMEGLYIKWEENGQVRGRYKYVRSNFTQTIIDGGVHHLERPVINNRLRDGTSLF